LDEFKFALDGIDTQIVDEFSGLIEQSEYAGAREMAADKLNPIKGLDLSNNQTYSEFKQLLEDLMRLITMTGGVGVDREQTIEEFANRFRFDCEKFPLRKIAQGGANAALRLCHIRHLYEILERLQIGQVLEYLKVDRPDEPVKTQE
jgi:hypothetical protein